MQALELDGNNTLIEIDQNNNYVVNDGFHQNDAQDPGVGLDAVNEWNPAVNAMPTEEFGGQPAEDDWANDWPEDYGNVNQETDQESWGQEENLDTNAAAANNDVVNLCGQAEGGGRVDLFNEDMAVSVGREAVGNADNNAKNLLFDITFVLMAVLVFGIMIGKGLI